MSRMYRLTLIFVGVLFVAAACAPVNPDLLKAADGGDAHSQYLVGLEYFTKKRDYEAAFIWFSRAAANGSFEAYNSLCGMYAGGVGVKANPEKAFETCTISANNGSASSQHNLAALYYYGMGVQQDYDLAFKWFSRAAESGYASSQSVLGLMYQNGMGGVTQDCDQAIYWYTRAAEARELEAVYMLGLLYYDGTCVGQDYVMAFTLFSDAAKPRLEDKQQYEIRADRNGSSNAQNMLGNMYFNSQGVGQDLQKSFFWFQKSAEQQNPAAMRSLATFYEYGIVTKRNPEKARELRESAEQILQNSANKM